MKDNNYKTETYDLQQIIKGIEKGTIKDESFINYVFKCYKRMLNKHINSCKKCLRTYKRVIYLDKVFDKMCTNKKYDFKELVKIDKEILKYYIYSLNTLEKLKETIKIKKFNKDYTNLILCIEIVEDIIVMLLKIKDISKDIDKSLVLYERGINYNSNQKYDFLNYTDSITKKLDKMTKIRVTQ